MQQQEILTDQAVLVCNHQTGIVTNQPSQHLVTIAGRPILVDNDPVNREITGCTFSETTISPCTLTTSVTSGYSELIRINGHRICLKPLTGLTNWAGAYAVQYKVRIPGQDLLVESTT